MPLHHPVSGLGDGPALHRPQDQVFTDLPRAEYTGAAPEPAAERLVTGAELHIPDRALVAGIVKDAPVSGPAAQFVPGLPDPLAAGAQPPCPHGADTAEGGRLGQPASAISSLVTEAGGNV